jgi:hypothetical protein
MLEYYKLLKKGLGTYAPSHETVRQWVNATNNSQKETDDTLKVQAQYWQPMNAM